MAVDSLTKETPDAVLSANKTTYSEQQQQQHAHNSDVFLLTGHLDSFKRGTRPGTILKKATGNEQQCLEQLMIDQLAPYVPKLHGTIELRSNASQYSETVKYLELQNLLDDFENPSVMDIKMGCRTYLEDELDFSHAKLRPDMYDKMTQVDPNEPTANEHKLKAITKARYMIWRETISSTADLGFRLEGMRLSDGTVDKEFKTIKKNEHICKAIMRYAHSQKIRIKYLNKLYDLRRALMHSKFFATHEMIGSSLFFVHDDNNVGVWLIDFAKTQRLAADVSITHRVKWELGNHEDGYLIGINNMIKIFESIVSRATNADKRSFPYACLQNRPLLSADSMLQKSPKTII